MEAASAPLKCRRPNAPDKGHSPLLIAVEHLVQVLEDDRNHLQTPLRGALAHGLSNADHQLGLALVHRSGRVTSGLPKLRIGFGDLAAGHLTSVGDRVVGRLVGALNLADRLNDGVNDLGVSGRQIRSLRAHADGDPVAEIDVVVSSPLDIHAISSLFVMYELRC